MTVRISPTEAVKRKGKARTKSKTGCGNCKLRSVKCDETKPQCNKCKVYGVACNYDRSYSELQLPLEKATSVSIRPQCLSYWPNKGEELLNKFQIRTAMTVSVGKRLQIYQNEVVRMAYLKPFLKYAIFALTLMHDRHISAIPVTKLSADEAYYWSKTLSLFNQKLSGPLHPEEQAALWTTSALLGTLTFCHIEAKSPEEAWPLGSSQFSDLTWLKMNDGKKEVWRIVRDLKHDPIFNALAAVHTNELIPPFSNNLKIDSLPQDFVRLYGLNDDTTSNNVYQTVATNFAKIMNVSDPIIIILSFLSFISVMNPEYKELLQQKDPAALLLLAYWYAKACQIPVWWFWRRTVFEGQAICMYLEKYFQHDSTISALLEFPKTIFGSPRMITNNYLPCD